MTPSELAAYHAGLRQAAEHALVTALALDIRPDGAGLRQRAAIQALRGLAEGLRAEALPASHATPLTVTQ